MLRGAFAQPLPGSRPRAFSCQRDVLVGLVPRDGHKDWRALLPTLPPPYDGKWGNPKPEIQLETRDCQNEKPGPENGWV